MLFVKVNLSAEPAPNLLAKLSVKIVNLPAVKQQLALSIWVNVPHATVCIRAGACRESTLTVANEAGTYRSAARRHVSAGF